MKIKWKTWTVGPSTPKDSFYKHQVEDRSVEAKDISTNRKKKRPSR